MESTIEVVKIVFGFLQAASVVAIPIWLSWYLGRRDKQLRKERETVIIPSDLEETVEKKKILNEMLGLMRADFGASRSQVWLFHNGGNYFIGDSIKRITMIEENNDLEEVGNIKEQFEGVPISRLERTLYPFAKKDVKSHHEYNDLRHEDALSEVNRVLKIIAWSSHKIMKDNKWVGLVFMSWDDHRELSTDEKILFKAHVKKIEDHLLGFNALSF